MQSTASLEGIPLPSLRSGEVFPSCSRCHEIVTNMEQIKSCHTEGVPVVHVQCLPTRILRTPASKGPLLGGLPMTPEWTKGHSLFCLQTLAAAHERVFHLEPIARRVEAWKGISGCACDLEKLAQPTNRAGTPSGLAALEKRAAKAKRAVERTKVVTAKVRAKTKARAERLKAWRSLYPGMPKAHFPVRWKPTAAEQARLAVSD